MKIVDNSGQKLTFGDVEIGSIFKVYGYYYIKLPLDCSGYNTFNLTTCRYAIVRDCVEIDQIYGEIILR